MMERLVSYRNDHDGEPLRVLLVDDDVFVREILGISLRDMGLTIIEAPDGVRAVEMLRERPYHFDALVTDLTLPGRVNGADVAATMRELRPEAPIVLMSGNVDVLASSGDPGFHALAKPFFAADLFRLLNQTVLGPFGQGLQPTAST